MNCKHLPVAAVFLFCLLFAACGRHQGPRYTKESENQVDESIKNSALTVEATSATVNEARSWAWTAAAISFTDDEGVRHAIDAGVGKLKAAGILLRLYRATSTRRHLGFN